MIGECVHHSDRILETVPARNLQDDSPIGGNTRRRDKARHLRVGELSVLGRECVDAWGDDLHLRRVELVPDVAAPRENEGRRAVQVRFQQLPRSANEIVRLVNADVRAPDDDRTGRAQTRHQPGALRIVNDDDVARLDHIGEGGCVALHRALVGGSLSR